MPNVYESTRDGRLKLRFANPAEYASALTAREMEVLHLLAQGLTNQHIAGILYLSTNTVRAHLYTIYNKLGVCTRIAAVHTAWKEQLLRLDELQHPGGTVEAGFPMVSGGR